MTPGDTVFDLANSKMSVTPFINFAARTKDKSLTTSSPQFGLCLKTYNSDLYQNWINTEWIEGVTGINEARAASIVAFPFACSSL